MANIIYKEESYKLNGAFFEVYKEKGCGFLEDVYQECLEIELELQGIDSVAQYPLKLEYKGRILRKNIFKTTCVQPDISRVCW